MSNMKNIRFKRSNIFVSKNIFRYLIKFVSYIKYPQIQKTIQIQTPILTASFKYFCYTKIYQTQILYDEIH